MTREQAIKLGAAGYGEIHYGPCRRQIGPRGGVVEHTVRVRPSGKCQTWKTRPEDFRLPIKHGFYQHGEITERNAGEFHVADECPLLATDAAV